MQLEWDPKKARANLRKHGVSFEEAAAALKDPMAATGPDPDHSAGDYRYITFAVSETGRLLVISHTKASDTVRIISARNVGKGERRIYEEG